MNRYCGCMIIECHYQFFSSILENTDFNFYTMDVDNYSNVICLSYNAQNISWTKKMFVLVNNIVVHYISIYLSLVTAPGALCC